jgi:hypothetical protein
MQDPRRKRIPLAAYALAHVLTIAISMFVGWVLVIAIFPLAFESPPDGVLMWLVASLLVAACKPGRREDE